MQSGRQEMIFGGKVENNAGRPKAAAQLKPLSDQKQAGGRAPRRQRKPWLFGPKRRSVARFASIARSRAGFDGSRTDDLQQKLTKRRESGSIHH
jgi:hypothetical protein